MVIEWQKTGAIRRAVQLRTETMDRQVWADTFSGLYHVPPLEVPPRTVLDLGCNIGLTAAHYCALWPEAIVVGVEMDHDSAEMARSNAPAAVIREHAVGSSKGFDRYSKEERTDSFSLGKGETEVAVLTLAETITDAFEDPYVDFLKMDIEGSEWGVLCDASWTPMVATVLVELHDTSSTSAAILELGITCLENLGFEARHHERHPQAVWAWR